MKIILTLLVLISVSVSASNVTTAKIVEVLVGPNYGNNVFLNVSPKPNGTPACKSNPEWDYVFDGSTDSGKITMSVALAAYAAGKEVWLAGSGNCTLYTNVEDLYHFVSK